VAQQKASLAQAKLNLSYTTIFAPAAGIIGKKTVEVGQNVTPGQQLMALVELQDIWIIANFKETQLRRMLPGQRVRFSVDAYTRVYRGRVSGIGGATGSRFSLLPPGPSRHTAGLPEITPRPLDIATVDTGSPTQI
jgi:membrane fusion protein (multidrug efflux system)